MVRDKLFLSVVGFICRLCTEENIEVEDILTFVAKHDISLLQGERKIRILRSVGNQDTLPKICRSSHAVQ